MHVICRYLKKNVMTTHLATRGALIVGLALLSVPTEAATGFGAILQSRETVFFILLN